MYLLIELKKYSYEPLKSALLFLSLQLFSLLFRLAGGSGYSDMADVFQCIIHLPKHFEHGKAQERPYLGRKMRRRKGFYLLSNSVFLFRSPLILAVPSYECKCGTGCVCLFKCRVQKHMFYSILFLELLKYHDDIFKRSGFSDKLLDLVTQSLCLGFQPRYPDLHLMAAHF